ncbi:MAG TPA: dihydroorotase [Spirochaetia bacterium]|nr:dihydroorotase [Spirochaetia bacterium]
MRDLVIRAPDDFHVHFRSGPGLEKFVRRTAALFDRALPMPNTLPPLADAASLRAYASSVRAAAPALDLVLSFKLLPGMDTETVRSLAGAGARVGKYYPAGATTHSSDGIREPGEIREALAAMEDAGLVLSVHGEDPAAPVLERERAFLPVVRGLLDDYPRLRIVLEHLSTREAAEFVAAGPRRLGATVTAHHLSFTTDDLAGRALNPHLYCKPVLQDAAHRAALRKAAAACERVFFGSDSAPHPRDRKESGSIPPGIYAAPVALPLLAAAFEEEDALDRLEDFASARGASFYGLPPNRSRVRLVRETWTVPDEVDGAVPAAAGSALAWTAERV